METQRIQFSSHLQPAWTFAAAPWPRACVCRPVLGGGGQLPGGRAALLLGLPVLPIGALRRPCSLTQLFLEPRGRHEGGSFSSMACRVQAALLERRSGGTASSRQQADSQS